MEKYKTRRPKQSEMLFGIRAILEAVEAGKNIDKVLIRRDMSSAIGKELLDKLPTNTPIQKVPVEKLNQYTDKNHQGVIAFISPIEFAQIENIILQCYDEGRTPFFLLLDSVTDVRNFGAISRSALCAGVDAVIIPMRGAVSLNADAVKASAGALLSLPVCKTDDLAKTIDYLHASGLHIYGATEHAQDIYTQADMTIPLAVVMGSEGFGIDERIQKKCDKLIKIPIVGAIESLNVSVATGIILFETVRQRQRL